MRLRVLLLCIFVGITIVCCVSRTVHQERFRDSMAATPATFTPSIPDPDHFSFAVVGDLHIGNEDTTRFRRILTAAAAESDAFVLLLGDLVDTGLDVDVAAYRKALQDLNYDTKVISVLGNHDIFADGWKSFLAANGPATFTVTAGNSKFVVLDTADASLGYEQIQWLNAESGKPKPTHVFWASHYSPIVPDQRTYLKLADEAEALRLINLATDWGVDTWFGAHYHSYVNKTIQGVTYLIAGGGGGRRMEPVAKFFFVQVNVSGKDLTYNLRIVD